MREQIPAKSVSHARALRASMTDAERKLWYALRDRRLQGVKFRRQAPIGRYIVDFLCVSHRLIIEADGSQHAENPRDAIRDGWLNENGYRVLRFTNREVFLETESVLATVAAACGLAW
jgi:2-isopropylmalate synthase